MTNSAIMFLLRCLAERLLPKELNLKRKQGFSLPLQAWFKGRWGNYCQEVLSEADRTLFDYEVIRRLLRDQSHGYLNSNRLFALMFFELWRRCYKVSV